MYKKIVLVFCGCSFFIGSIAQTTGIGKLLIEIEQNNTDLKAYQAFMEGNHLENEGSNNLPDPELSVYHLPFGSNTNATYTEYQVSQSLEFPTVYSARKKWNELQDQQLESAYTKLRQDILLKAKQAVIALIAIQKYKKTQLIRVAQSQQIHGQIQELFNKAQVGILELNKSKIAWLQEQFSIQQIDVEIQNNKGLLELLNGGKSIDFNILDIDTAIEVGSFESLWKEKLTTDTALKTIKAKEELSKQNIILEQRKVLPNLTAGYNYQGISGNNSSGFYGGISIPLWNSKHKVKAAKANYLFQQFNTKLITERLYANYKVLFNRYQLILQKYQEYQSTMTGLNGESLLLKAFTLGEYSFMEYYVELEFYHNAYDKMLQMEKELFQLKAELLQHQL